jgi:hypothetical protein
VEESTRVFSRIDNSIQTMEISFNVVPNASGMGFQSQTLTVSLTEYESSTSLILNDLDGPSLSISSTTGEVGFVNEGDTITVILITPKAWPDGTVVPYDISGISASDLSGTTDPNYSDLSGSFIIYDSRGTIDFIVDDSFETEGNEVFAMSLGYVSFEDERYAKLSRSYSDVSAQIIINDTSQRPIYALSITNTNGDEITEINEGETFIVSLEVAYLDTNSEIPYVITGIDYSDLVGETSINLNSSFIVGNTMSRTFVLRDDQTNDGDKTMAFTIPLDDSIGDDVVQTLVIKDTSQSPIIKVGASKNGVPIGNDANKNNFDITITIENYTMLTSLQKAQQYRYTISGVTNADISNESLLGFIRLSNATVNDGGNYTITKTYTCGTDETKIFTFTLNTVGSVSVEFNSSS